jgi:HEXXH motif-containing protein
VKFTSISSINSEGQLAALHRLRSAELGKHKILLASIMRMAERAIPGDYERALFIPYQLLSDVEALASDVAAALIAAPQFGAWADDCLRRLLNDGARQDVPLATDLGHLTLFAATAAMRAGHPFDLEVPLRNGTVSFPTLGTARPGASTPWEWGLARQDGLGCWVQSSASTVEIPQGDHPRTPAAAQWSALHRIVHTENGLRLDVLLDDGDPFLDRYGTPRMGLTSENLPAWRHLLTSAWATLAGDHHPLAVLIAGTVRTLVPLAQPAPTRSVASTTISSFGAVALSLRADALSVAEVLVHEAHHAVLGALIDIEPLVRNEADFLAYAPWRDDPRPGGALLHGIFAHYGMGRFWRTLYRAGPPAQRTRAAVEFGRMRTMAARGSATLDESGLLTDVGQEFLAGIREQLADWLEERLPADAEEQVADLGADHQVQWRLAHLLPAPDGMASLADAWRAHRRPPVPVGAVPVRLEPGSLPPASANLRSYLLSLRYKDPPLLRRRLADDDWVIDPADAALIRGEYDAAAARYLRRIAAGQDPGAWAGLAIVRRRTGPAPIAFIFTERPEVLAALHGLLRDDADATPDQLASWLAP